jgi:predicted nucleic acid-binding protein
VKRIVVADAGPLIGLARVDRLELLEKLYRQITIAPRVLEELKLSSEKPGAKIISAATDAGWLKVSQLKKKDDHSILNLLVDAGEAESIQMALEQNAKILIIDDRKGRKIAKSRYIRIIGTGGILIAAKRKGVLDKVAPIMDDLADVGYCLSPDLCKRILELADEG